MDKQTVTLVDGSPLVMADWEIECPSVSINGVVIKIRNGKQTMFVKSKITLMMLAIIKF